MAYCLVTPASRGIGHALTKHLLTTTKVPVVATARKDIEGARSSILDGLKGVDEGRLTVLELDVCGMCYVCLAMLSVPRDSMVYEEWIADMICRGGECQSRRLKDEAAIRPLG